MKKLILFVFLTLILTTSLASAQCFSVKLSKQSYLSGETFQAEITGKLEKAITINDLHFYEGNKEYFPAFDLEQIANDQWVAWTNTPTRYGENKFSVTALCKEDILEEQTIEANFLIQRPLQEAYSWLISQIDERWPTLSVDEASLSLRAIEYNSQLHEKGEISLLTKSNVYTCWPFSCEVKSTALAVLALKGSLQEEQIKNWILDAENNIDIGLWDLLITSNEEQACNLTINEETQQITLNSGFNQPISLILPDNPEIIVSTTCSVSSAKISHTYLGSVNEFALLNDGSEYTTTLNNRKCWGESYRSECDATHTAYAIEALQELGESNLQEEISWLKENLDTTVQRALYYSFTKDSDVESWLINNQALEGYWSEKALAISNTPDIVSTILATKHLSNQKGEAWLKNIFEVNGRFGNIEETAYALQIFSSDKIESLVSSKGLIKSRAGRNITINFNNNGILPISLTITIFGSAEKLDILAFGSKSLTIKVPAYSTITFTEAEISYQNAISENKRSYSIPIVILPTGAVEGQIINETSAGGSLFPSQLEFTPNNITIIADNDEFSIDLELKSLSEETLLIGLSLFGISDILQSIEPSSFELLPGQTQLIKVTFNTAEAVGQYVGSINAETIGSSVSLPVSITLESEGDTGEVSDSKEETKKEGKGFSISNKVIGWSMLVLAVLLSAWFVYSKLKKKPEHPLKKFSLDMVGRQMSKR